ncbi:hypothetical protein [Photobacterium gaetbulicola]|nr:hypothetical protein [Photobacterium gaetbulicola]
MIKDDQRDIDTKKLPMAIMNSLWQNKQQVEKAEVAPTTTKRQQKEWDG